MLIFPQVATPRAVTLIGQLGGQGEQGMGVKTIYCLPVHWGPGLSWGKEAIRTLWCQSGGSPGEQVGRATPGKAGGFWKLLRPCVPDFGRSVRGRGWGVFAVGLVRGLPGVTLRV